MSEHYLWTDGDEETNLVIIELSPFLQFLWGFVFLLSVMVFISMFLHGLAYL